MYTTLINLLSTIAQLAQKELDNAVTRFNGFRPTAWDPDAWEDAQYLVNGIASMISDGDRVQFITPDPVGMYAFRWGMGPDVTMQSPGRHSIIVEALINTSTTTVEADPVVYGSFDVATGEFIPVNTNNNTEDNTMNTYTISKCNTCGFRILDVGLVEAEMAQHMQDHVALNTEAAGFTSVVVESDEYWEEFEYGAEEFTQYRSELANGFQPADATFGQWHIHNYKEADMVPSNMDALKAFFKANHDQKDSINWSYDIEVLMSGAGYYIGMLDPEDGAPYCRLSTNYWATFEEAQQALDTGHFTPKLWL